MLVTLDTIVFYMRCDIYLNGVFLCCSYSILAGKLSLGSLICSYAIPFITHKMINLPPELSFSESIDLRANVHFTNTAGKTMSWKDIFFCLKDVA